MVHDSLESINEQINKKPVILDVRTPEEFDEGHIEGSINMPLHEIPAELSNLKNSDDTYIAVCRSGNRSHQATLFLKSNGFDVVNGGPWDFLDGILKG